MKSSAGVNPSLLTFNPRKVKKVTTEYLDKLITAGLGQGALGIYRPWIQVTSFGSRGSSHIVPGVKIPRTHHLLSNAEHKYFVLMEFRPDVIDIREQFPLLEYFETHSIAVSKNIKPSLFRGTDVPWVYTTDFMLTMVDKHGDSYLQAVTLKYKSEFEKATHAQRLRILEKFEVEQEYWSRRGVDWISIYEEDLPKVKISNLLRIRGYADIGAKLSQPALISSFLRYFSDSDTEKLSTLPLSRVIHSAADYLYIPHLDARRVFFYLVWNHRIIIDLDSAALTLSKPVEFLGFVFGKELSSPGVHQNEKSNPSK